VKKFADLLENSSENGFQLDESTSRGRGSMKVDSESGEIQSIEAKLVVKSDADMPNIEMDFTYKGSKLETSFSVTKGRFEDKRFYKKFSKMVEGVFDNVDSLENMIYTASNKDYAKVEKAFSKMGVNIKTDMV
tara:strand:- start:26209 stop:26607 length:399 start_codon:yes stop_codon:yes gene_type:complete